MWLREVGLWCSAANKWWRKDSNLGIFESKDFLINSTESSYVCNSPEVLRRFKSSLSHILPSSPQFEHLVIMEVFLLFILSLIPEQDPAVMGLPACSSLVAKTKNSLEEKSCKEGEGRRGLDRMGEWEEKGTVREKNWGGMAVLGDLLLLLRTKASLTPSLQTSQGQVLHCTCWI